MSGIRDSIKKAMAQLVEPGNIDIENRKVMINPDGSFSTESSMSFGEDGSEVLIPTVVNGRRLPSPEAAIGYYHHTGEHLGKFSSPEAAEAYAKALHTAQERRYRAIAAAMEKTK